MNDIIWLVIFCSVSINIFASPLYHEFPARPLLPNKTYRCCSFEPYVSHREVPIIYCYKGSPRTVYNIWGTASAIISLSPNQYDLYEGYDSDQVWSQFETRRSSWTFNILNWRKKHIPLDPFNSTCIGIQTDQDFQLWLQVTDVDYLRVGAFLFGVVLFFVSPSLANNALFYYITGITVGVLASVLIVFYFIIKILPLKKPTMLGVMAGGSGIALYFFQIFYENILVLLFTYQEYVIGYLLLSGLISFIICYRFGPVSNERSKNLIKWSLQAFSLLVILFSSHFQEAMLAADAVILFFYNVPVFRWFFSLLKLVARLMFSSKKMPRLLTEDEFKTQGEVETRRGLIGLRGYCSSPECQQWSTVLRLKDPKRFAEFIEGQEHVTRNEQQAHEEEMRRVMEELLTDDSEEED